MFKVYLAAALRVEVRASNDRTAHPTGENSAERLDQVESRCLVGSRGMLLKEALPRRLDGLGRGASLPETSDVNSIAKGLAHLVTVALGRLKCGISAD